MTRGELRSWRLEHNITQAEAAAMVGRSRRGWQQWEAGERPLPPDLPIYIEHINRRLEAGDLWKVPGRRRPRSDKGKTHQKHLRANRREPPQ